MTPALIRRQQLVKIWQAAVAAVAGEQAVINALETDAEFAPDLILAVGKAAVGMCRGALDRLPGCTALVVTKYAHADADLRARATVEIIEAAHPIPDDNSLLAGRELLAKMRSMPAHSKVLLLISGGASALAEALPDAMKLTDLQQITDQMIAGGKTIAQINQRRKQTSLIKDGKLIAAFNGAEIRVYAISDVEGDNIATIGSGLGDCHRATTEASCRIIASNGLARAQAVQMAQELGLMVCVNEESLYGDLFALAPIIGARLRGAKAGVYIWGGEPTVVLPENPGHGGRNQSLALALAEQIAGFDNLSLLVAGTDGTDGPTAAAGGLVDGSSWTAAASRYLQAADAGSYLQQRNCLFVTGPTHTNVMDLVIAIVSPS